MAKRAASAYYDVWARTYDQRWQHYMDTTLAQILARLDLAPSLHVVDIGCGTGTLLDRIAELAPTAWLTGIDASRGMLRMARRKLKGRERVSLLHGDAEALSVADQTQDLVTIASMLHYVYRPSRVCAEVYRVLKPGGMVAVVGYVPSLIGGSGIDGLIRRYDPGHVRCRSRRELAAMFGWAGFTAVQVDEFPIDATFRGVIATARHP